MRSDTLSTHVCTFAHAACGVQELFCSFSIRVTIICRKHAQDRRETRNGERGVWRWGANSFFPCKTDLMYRMACERARENSLFVFGMRNEFLFFDSGVSCWKRWPIFGSVFPCIFQCISYSPTINVRVLCYFMCRLHDFDISTRYNIPGILTVHAPLIWRANCKCAQCTHHTKPRKRLSVGLFCVRYSWAQELTSEQKKPE